jgi:hypothetical protein
LAGILDEVTVLTLELAVELAAELAVELALELALEPVLEFTLELTLEVVEVVIFLVVRSPSPRSGGGALAGSAAASVVKTRLARTHLKAIIKYCVLKGVT